MGLTFTKHNKIALKNHPDFSEVWLHDCICEDTSLLGLGNLDVVERERSQCSGGRLDVLLADTVVPLSDENNRLVEEFNAR